MEGRLKMNGNGIVNPGADTPLGQIILERIAVRDPDDIQMPDRFGEVSLHGPHDGALGQQPVIECGMLAAGGVPTLQVFQLDAQNSRLQGIEAAVVTP